MKDVRELVKVTPLEWKDIGNVSFCRAFNAPNYEVVRDRESDTWFAREIKGTTSLVFHGAYATRDEAKDEIQRHHETRIYALLEPLPEPPEASK